MIKIRHPIVKNLVWWKKEKISVVYIEVTIHSKGGSKPTWTGGLEIEKMLKLPAFTLKQFDFGQVM